MTNLNALRSAVRDYGCQYPDTSFAICYGSSVLTGSSTSDLDMLIVENTVSTPTWQDNFTQQLVNLHHQESRATDEEVPYANKLFYSLDEIRESLSQEMFWRQIGANGYEDSEFSILTFTGTAENDPYFSSSAMKLRLALNAFTSSHMLLAGNRDMYCRTRHAAVLSLGHLVAQLAGEHIKTIGSLEARLLLERCGDASYKDFLGYQHRDHTFRQSLAHGLSDIRTQLELGRPVLGEPGHAFLRKRVHDILMRAQAHPISSPLSELPSVS